VVVLISIDGFRFDYLDRGITPVLSRLAAEGAMGPMRPSFPSVTFSNHYTLVTGVHPDHHGITNNTMEDAELGRFSPGSAVAVADRRWWDQGKPIWVTAEEAGLVTAFLFWPGSEAAIHGVRPTYWRPYDKSLSSDARADQVLTWLDLAPGQRPDLTGVYFDAVDTAGHHFGPVSEETDEALRGVDAAIGRLLEGLKARGMFERATLIVVSDHGMAATSAERVTWLEDLVDPSAVHVIQAGAITLLNPALGREAEVEDALLGRKPHLECWRKADIPSRYVLGRNARVPAIACLSEPGWLFVSRTRTAALEPGAHGYDNTAPDMTALFIAHGSSITPGCRLEDLDSVDVQPLLGALLAITVPSGDGKLTDTMPALRDMSEPSAVGCAVQERPQ
jgi:predicted AlkP superfamily pyrophosphatase or phosphodiesterase